MPNLPCPGMQWTACSAAWHVDEPTPPGTDPGRVLIAFMLLDRLESGGGATVVLAGSNRRLVMLANKLATPITTDVALAHLSKEEPWFADLFKTDGRTSGEECISGGISLRIQELTGEPGDVVLMDPRCLHTTSANVSPRPRLTMRLTCVRV